MNSSRRHTFKLLAATLAIGAAFAPALSQAADSGLRSGKIFTSSNAADGNMLMVYEAAGGGALNLVTQVATGGAGTGAGLGSQGAVTLSGSGRYLFVVNAQSNTVSTFIVREKKLELASVVASGGQLPVSVTEREGLVYVLNSSGDGGVGNVTGFRNDHGRLTPVSGAVQPLSIANAGPAQVSVSSNGDALVVTEKNTNLIGSYRVRGKGRLDAPSFTASSGATPFGFAFDSQNRFYVSEAFGGAPGLSALSSYRLDEFAPAMPVNISPSVGTTQTAACWVAVTPNGKFAYTANTGSATISSYRIHSGGDVSLIAPAAGTTVVGSSPIDLAVTPDGRSMYALTARGIGLDAFAVASNGALTHTASVAALPVGTVGLAAN